MTEAFETYLEDYESARAAASRRIDAYESCTEEGQREQALRSAQDSIGEVERYLRLLENEAKQSGNTSAKRKCTNELARCRKQLAGLKSNLEKAIVMEGARARGAQASQPSDGSSREQMERYQQQLDRNGQQLDEAHRQLASAQGHATNLNNNLQDQRNALERARIDAEGAQAATEEAKHHLTRLAWKAMTNKICLIFVIICLIVAIALVSYFKWYPRDKTDHLGVLPSPSPVAPSPTPSTDSSATPSLRF